MNQSRTIVFAGGGTGGPTTPLLAVAEELKEKYLDLRLVFVGTANGPEKKLVEDIGLDFFSIPSAKWRRYFSLRNIIDIFVFPFAVTRAFLLLNKLKAKVVVSAGGFVAVPVIWAAKLLGVKVLVHQQDIFPGLANRLSLPFADRITYTFPEAAKDFPKGTLTGNPVRKSILTGDRVRGVSSFGLHPEKPVILVFGGGTGALQLNKIAEEAVPSLLDKGFQVLHITGTNVTSSGEYLDKISEGYVRRAFLGREMADAYAVADIVVCRAGLGTISELSNLQKVVIIVPMPNSHQEKNAEVLKEKSAAVVIEQKYLTAQKLSDEISNLIINKEQQNNFKKNISEIMPHDATSTIASLVYNLLNLS